MNQEVITLEKAQETIPAIEIQMKQCRRKDCLKLKPVKEFTVNKTMADGYHSYCKECLDKYNKDYQLKRNEQKLAELKAGYEIKPNEPIDGFIQCRKKDCRKFKPIAEFYKGLSPEGGLNLYCISCRKDRAKKSYLLWKEKTKDIEFPVADESTLKQCSNEDCLQFKPLSCFTKGLRYKDGYRTWCKDCDNKYSKIWRDRRNELYPKLENVNKRRNKGLLTTENLIGIAEAGTSQLRQCQRSTCEQFKPLSEFNVSMLYADGYSPVCKTCILIAILKEAINKELAQKAIENYVHPDDIIFHPIPFDDFFKLKLISRPNMAEDESGLKEKRTPEYFLGRKIKNPYQFSPEDEYIHIDEYAYGEPASSHKDFMQLTAPDRSYQKKAETILENWNELAELA